ncbi:MAG: anti-sigma F factor [Clostridia bacterium]|nr:anti-sigma F factor [Clostridia bacterium]
MINETEIVFTAKSENESFARSAVAAFYAQLDPTLEELCDVKTAVSEAVTNAIIHGYRDDGVGKVYITLRILEDKTLFIKVKDKGCGIEDIRLAMTPLYSGDPSGERGGMGFSIMESFTDDLKVVSSVGKGTSITMIKRYLPIEGETA